MLWRRRNKKQGHAQVLRKNCIQNCPHLNHNLFRKEMLSPLIHFKKLRQSGAFFFAPLKGALTVEAALVLPLFLFCMIAALQYGQVMETAVRLGCRLADTAKEMGAAAYLYEYPEDAQESPGIAVSALSAVWAQTRVMRTAGDTSDIKNANMALSSFLAGDQMIDLVMTYQIRSPVRIVRLPGYFFLQRASVRAWTGRLGGREGDGKDEEEGGDTVYVTVTGSVYHEDPECTYLKLSVREVGRDMLEGLRNSGGSKYHACEICGDSAGDSVYITNEGDRYHSSLSCRGLKRTVREVTREEAKHLKACSKCGGHGGEG